MVVDLLSRKLNIAFKKGFFSNYFYGKGVYSDKEIYLIKPLTYMNSSGEIIDRLNRRLGISLGNIVVIADSMDLFPGIVRFKLNGGDAGHNGLKSVIAYAGSNDIKRFYIGIGRPADSSRVVDHVLGIPDEKESVMLEKGIKTAADGIMMLLDSSPGQVMNEINKIKNRSDN